MSDKITVINSEDVPQQDFREIPWICKFDGDKYGTNNFYSVHWNMPQERVEVTDNVGHPPHMHKENEIMMLIGMDPENPDDLGAEVQMCIGEDMEKHIFTKSCTVIIPGGTPHGNFRIVESKRPWMFVQVQEAVPRTEKFLWDYLTPEQIEAIPNKDFWKDTGYED